MTRVFVYTMYSPRLGYKPETDAEDEEHESN